MPTMAPERGSIIINNNNNGGVGGGGGGGGGGRTLHNFALPPKLSWGTQKLLRCSNSTSSLSAAAGGGGGFSPPQKRRRNTPERGDEVRTWNLRTRRGVEVDEAAAEVAAAAAVVPRVKFSVALTRSEIEDDFVAILGRRPPRKPKKRPRYIQKQLDTVFPGLWLSEITADMYKVNETPELPITK